MCLFYCACHTYWICADSFQRLPTFVEIVTKASRFAPCWQGAESLAPARQTDASKSKSGPNVLTSTCAACRNRVTFSRQLNFQKCSEAGVSGTCGLRHVSMCHTGVHFFDMSTYKGAPNMKTWKSALHRRIVPFFMSHLARWLRIRRFSEPTCRPLGTRSVLRLVHFSCASTFFLLTLSSDLLLLTLSLFLSVSSHLGFSCVHIVGNLTSKLPSAVVSG